ncbi:hypothetical protein CCR75_006140 [Bremia lactucae]|uniref:Polymerase nucleotidyl transferase domain-containing protein n=1 Tax=Bremia lactucae TaxID=4779 RepID=A0A976FFF1_BRELC|nr:hypothetical protein CCR75_006140 [Bremia lactucae]
MNLNNPFYDPSVVQMQSPATPIMNFPTMAPPAPVMPVGGTIPSVYDATPGLPHQNLMDEIGAQIKSTNSQTIIKVMRTLNLVLASATIVVGVLAWLLGQVNNFQKVIAGIYIIMFGALLLLFELRTEKMDEILRKNFGFMYGNKTRTIFLVFIAIWPLSMGNFWLTILDAVLLFLNAFFNYFVISKHPAFSSVLPVYDIHQPPHAGGYAPAPQRSKQERKNDRLNRRKIAAAAERDALAREREAQRIAAINRCRLRRLPPWLPTLPSTNVDDAAVLRDLNDATRSVALRLGYEMNRYCIYTQRVVDAARQYIDAAIAHIVESVRKIWPHASVTCFGSYSTGLWLPSSDVDVVVMGLSNATDRDVPTTFLPDGVPELEQLAQQLRPQTTWVQQVDVVRGAKVPVAKVILRHEMPHKSASALLRVDISIENVQTSYGLDASQLVRDYVTHVNRLKPLLMVLRQFLREKGLNSAFTGGLSTYAVTLLAVFLLEMQRHQDEEENVSNDQDESKEAREARALGQLLLDFLEYYGTSFDYMTTGLSLKPEAFGAYPLAAQWPVLPLMPQLVIDDPVYKNGQHNAAAGAFALARVVAAFENGFFALWYHRPTQFTPTPLCQLLHWSGHETRDASFAFLSAKQEGTR